MIKNTIHKIIIVFSFLVLLSCGKEKQEITTIDETVKTDSVPQAEKENISVVDEATSKMFRIGKGSLGPITIGMTMAKADAYLTEFSKQKAEAYDFGYDGGGDAWIYSRNNKRVLALVPSRDVDSIIAIVAIDQGLKNSKGASPGMNVKELLRFYPNTKIYFNAMMGWEEIIDNVNGWKFIFMTSDENRIGEYKDVDKPSLPKRFDIKSDWITITKPETKNDCSLLHEGTFTYKDSQGENVVVKINDNTWTEEHNNGQYITIAKMKWKSNCEYENMLVMSSLPGFKLAPGTVMDVTIDKVDGFDIYFTATAAGKSYHSMITKI